MEKWQTNFKVQASLQGELFFYFSKNNSLYIKRYSQGTVYYVIDQPVSPDRRELTNRSSMSNQEPKKIAMQVPTSGVRANHMRQTYAVTSSRRGWKSFPPGQAAGPRNESVLVF